MLSKPITISDWKKGMHISPYAGFSQMRGIDPNKVDGCASIELAPVVVSFTITQPSLINWILSDKSGVVYFLDNTGKVFKTTDYATAVQISGNTTTDSYGNGFAYWKNHIFVARKGVVDAYLSPTWTSALATLSVSQNMNNPMFVGQDDVLYIGNGRFVASISEVAGKTFNAADSTTWEFKATALSLPQDYIITCFAEISDTLMIGTFFGTSSPNVKVSDIFSWDRDTTHSYSIPIRMNNEGVNSIINNNNTLYISSGYQGDILVSNGVSVSELSKIPLDVKEKNGSSGLRIIVFPDAMEFLGNELLIGASQSALTNTKTDNPIGVFGLLKDTIRYIGNTTLGKDGSDGTAIQITSIHSVNPFEFFVAWATNGTYGVDHIVPSNNKIGSYGAYCESEMYLVGSDREPATLECFDFYLNKPLVSGDGIRLSYRTSASGSYTEIITLDFATYGAVNTYSFQNTITNLKTVQFKLELTATSTTTPELRAIIIK
jgi:hypothetical protein